MSTTLYFLQIDTPHFEFRAFGRNMTMWRAFVRALQREPDLDSDHDTDLMNAAWTAAKPTLRRY